ncbi:MAG: class I SAM-dependent methyltransferase [Flavobacteriales bacterium]|nr:class I SAM-dependent methyltransferase [Flavobacteriales bacterium]MCB0381214.1 class I SAM-dependent methyltransferase [Flavobacteriales bacterium]MCB9173004.1 class I SAM-dependent methyltransferase [Flavobacteriales bacterium]
MSSERQEINKVSPWWGEHLHRYEEILKSFSGTETILDIACGSGFGTHLLATKTEGKVYGGDLSSDAINLCQKTWRKNNLSFQIMDGTNLCFEDDYFDIVVSFETIEHTTEFNKMINEFKRVLKPNGIIYLSTPNIIINSPSGIVTNPYHTQEWNYEEFIEILNFHFNSFDLYGQKYNRYAENKNIGYYIEKLLYKKGVRKLPIKFQDYIMNVFGQPSIYPKSSEFILVNNSDEIRKCKTFFAVCR